MYYWYFKLFNNIKSEHEAREFARLELENLFGNVEPINNFADKLKEDPLSRFIDSSIRLQDFITHELPYGKVHGYFGVSDGMKCLNKLVKRLAYTREIYLIVNTNSSPESLAKEFFMEDTYKKNFHYFKVEDFICFRFITNQYFIEKSEYISKLSRNEKEVEKNVEILFSHLISDIYRIPASSTLSIGKRLQDYFAIREETSLYLTHYFHPYKGKFHPKMVKALLNYIFPYDKGVILDNFAGSGTLLVEAALTGLDSVGIEINPLSVLMSNVKCKSFLIAPEKLKIEINNYFEKVRKTLLAYNNMEKGQLSLSIDPSIDFNKISKKSENLSFKLKNHLRNKEKVIPQVLVCKELLKNVQDNEVRNFLLLALSGTISDVARRTSEEFLDVFRGRVNDLFLRIFLFRKLNEVLKINLGQSNTYVGDTRNIKSIIDSNSIDGIVNSPPYSVALDYIKNDFPQLVLLELTDSIEKLEEDMIGNPKVNYDRKSLFEKLEEKANPLTISETANKIVRELISNGRQQAGLRSFKFYIDISESLKEMYRVMKNNSKCAIVIGNNHFMVGDQYIEIPNDKVVLELAEKIGFTLDKFIGRELQKSSEGNIREETVLILKKEEKSK